MTTTTLLTSSSTPKLRPHQSPHASPVLASSSGATNSLPVPTALHSSPSCFTRYLWLWLWLVGLSVMSIGVATFFGVFDFLFAHNNPTHSSDSTSSSSNVYHYHEAGLFVALMGVERIVYHATFSSTPLIKRFMKYLHDKKRHFFPSSTPLAFSSMSPQQQSIYYVETMHHFLISLKSLQFIPIFLFIYRECLQQEFLRALDIILFKNPVWLTLIALVCIVMGQILNFTVYQKIGKAGVYYGAKFGVTIPWCTSFPFNFINHPQYSGVVICIFGLFFLFTDTTHLFALVPSSSTSFLSRLDHHLLFALPGSLTSLLPSLFPSSSSSSSSSLWSVQLDLHVVHCLFFVPCIELFWYVFSMFSESQDDNPNKQVVEQKQQMQKLQVQLLLQQKRTGASKSGRRQSHLLKGSPSEFIDRLTTRVRTRFNSFQEKHLRNGLLMRMRRARGGDAAVENNTSMAS